MEGEGRERRGGAALFSVAIYLRYLVNGRANRFFHHVSTLLLGSIQVLNRGHYVHEKGWNTCRFWYKKD